MEWTHLGLPRGSLYWVIDGDLRGGEGRGTSERARRRRLRLSGCCLDGLVGGAAATLMEAMVLMFPTTRPAPA